MLPVGLAVACAGYFGPWIDHRVAGLVITGLDLGEYVKFLPVVRDGTVALWRPGFYAPLVAISAAATCASYRSEFAYRWWLRVPLLVLATVTALNLLPPAWTPARLVEAEFRVQMVAMLLLLGAMACAPLLALLPHRIAGALVAALALAGIAWPLHGFFQVLPAIAMLYNRDLAPGWGPWLTVAGLVTIAIVSMRLAMRPTHVQRNTARWSKE